MDNIFYTYVYLDPRKPGKFTYDDYVSFLYQPFYVGKGHNNRLFEHVNGRDKLNKHKYHKIKNIRSKSLEPIIFMMIKNLEEKCSFCFEKFLIKLIGRSDLGLGPLCNHTDGGEGGVGFIMTDEIKRKISERKKGMKDTIESRNKKSLARLGSKNPAYNKVWIHNNKESILIYNDRLEEYLNNGWIRGVLDTTRLKTSLQWKGVEKSEDHKNKIGLSNIGKTLGRKAGDEERRKKSIARLGNKNPARILKFKKELQIYMVAF